MWILIFLYRLFTSNQEINDINDGFNWKLLVAFFSTKRGLISLPADPRVMSGEYTRSIDVGYRRWSSLNVHIFPFIQFFNAFQNILDFFFAYDSNLETSDVLIIVLNILIANNNVYGGHSCRIQFWKGSIAPVVDLGVSD